MAEKSLRKIKASTARRWFQALSLLFFLVLVSVTGPWQFNRRLFLQFDPLASILAILASRVFLRGMLWGIVLLVASAVFGRFFCGYLCPMGTMLDILDWIGFRSRKRMNLPQKAKRIRFWLLAGMLMAAATGFQAAGWMDPIVLATRFWGTFIMPSVRMILSPLATHFHIKPLVSWIGPASNALSLAAWTSLFWMIGLAMLNRWGERFWCRYLCPLGALISIAGRRPLFRRHVVDEKCTSCRRCTSNCPMDAIGDDFYSTYHEDCILCHRCTSSCPVNIISFRFVRSPSADRGRIMHGRRKFLQAAGAGLALGVIGKMTGARFTSKRLIRPPASIPEDDFLKRCLRCGACVAACPTGVLQQSWLRAGLIGSQTPLMLTSSAACDENCNACGQVCPVEAIRPMPLEEKSYAKTGTAIINRELCLPWSYGKECTICRDACPYNAIDSIVLEEKTPLYPSGKQYDSITRPVVSKQLCIGCGACETNCPVAKTGNLHSGQAAITVWAYGEMRLKTGNYKNPYIEQLRIDAKNRTETVRDDSASGDDEECLDEDI